MNGTLALAAAAVLLVGWGVFVFTLASKGGNTLYDPDEYGLCAPSRHANITASVPQAQRRVLGPPAGWHEPQHVAIFPAPGTAYDVGLGDWVVPQPVGEEDWDDEDWDDEPETELPVAVPSWPIRQVEPELVPVVVSSTAARFAALELYR